MLPLGDLPLQPWATIQGGYAHYTSFRPLPLTPVFAVGDDKRGDFLLALGGGLEARVHPKLSLGFETRGNFSFTNQRNQGERDLTALGLSAFAAFHF